MKSVKNLPDTYAAYRTVDFRANKALALGLNLVALVLFFGIGWLLLWLALVIHPDMVSSGNFNLDRVFALWLIGAGILVFILHELIHGLFFWIFTGDRPTFGLTPYFAYAAAPRWYLPRNLYLVVGLSPLLGISILGFAAFFFVPVRVLLIILFAMAINAAGAVGDICECGLLFALPGDVLVRDSGPSVTVYRPDRS